MSKATLREKLYLLHMYIKQETMLDKKQKKGEASLVFFFITHCSISRKKRKSFAACSSYLSDHLRRVKSV